MRQWMVWGLIAVLMVGCAPQTSVPNAPTIDSALPPTSTPAQAAVPSVEPTVEPAAVLPLVLRSPAFEDGGVIPQIHTCDGEDLSPELIWENVPAGAVSLALVFDDPDAGNWVHWVAYDLPADTPGLPGGLGSELPGGVLGANTWGDQAYGGPCPPTGTHRYVFKLFALDSRLELGEGASVEEVLSAADGHILATAELRGAYPQP